MSNDPKAPAKTMMGWQAQPGPQPPPQPYPAAQLYASAPAQPDPPVQPYPPAQPYSSYPQAPAYSPPPAQPGPLPPSYQPSAQQPYQGAPLPFQGPGGFQPSAQQPYAPASYQPSAQQPYPPAPASYQPSAQPYPPAPASYQPSAQQPYPPSAPAYPQHVYAPPAGPQGFQPSAPYQEQREQADSDSRRAIAGANATEGRSARLVFIRKTYVHLLGAIVLFAGLEYLLMTNAALLRLISVPFVNFALAGRWQWGVVLAAFVVVSAIATFFSTHVKSKPVQYFGLGLYVVAEAVMFVPLLAIVEYYSRSIIARGGGDPHIIRDAAFVTLGIFGSLTAVVLLMKKDFTFLAPALAIAGAAATMLVILSLVFGFNLGIVFSVAMVVLCAGYILFQTSQILAHRDPSEHVGAALELFSSIALMFWYVIRIFLRLRAE